MTNKEASEWFKKRAQEAPMPGAREAFKLAAEALANADVPDTNVGDMISRQAAIDYVDCGHLRPPTELAWSDLDVVNMLKRLPSAEPQIIRCKDCKYRMPYDWMFSETWQSQNMDDYPDDEIGCLYCDMAMKADDYCSRAERIKGDTE